MGNIICGWCEAEIEEDNGHINVDGMHDVCATAAARLAVVEDNVARDYDPQLS
jgi:hypothetical protein